MAVEGTVTPVRGAHVLDLDPDLGRNIDPPERELARGACHGEVLQVSPGPWLSAGETIQRDDLVALIVVDGVLAREVGLRDRCMLELLGPADVLQPPVGTVAPSLGGGTRLTAVSDLVVLVLGQSFIHGAARWPSLLARLQRRLESQREGLAIQGLIAHLPNAEDRLLLMLWHLADRWGYVTPEGTVLPLALSHEILAQLIGARRPTATLALRALAAGRMVHRRDDGSWLLTATAERTIDALTRPTKGSRSLGERVMLHRRSSETMGEGRAPRAEGRQIMTSPRTSAKWKGGLTPAVTEARASGEVNPQAAEPTGSP